MTDHWKPFDGTLQEEPTPLPVELEVLREKQGTLQLLLHLADLEERDKQLHLARLERAPAGAAALLALGLRQLVKQYGEAVRRGGLEAHAPGRDDADRQAWSGRRARVKGH